MPLTDATLNVLGLVDEFRGALEMPEPYTPNHDEINGTIRDLVVAIDQNAPDCADKTAAIRCARIVRNTLLDLRRVQTPSMDVSALPRLLDAAEADLHRARWQASAAIALGGR